jgi:protein gp37
MGKQTEIAWTDSTFNPWIGCAKVSAGCANCYAETLMDKRMGRVEWGVNGTRVRTSDAYWRQPLKWNREAWKIGRRRVFCASLADVFEDRPELSPWRTDLFALINATPHLDWLLLTKRPENVIEMVVWDAPGCKLPDNVWLGTSVENQEQADKRIPLLLTIPASVRFLSMEPLLGRVDFRKVPGFNRVDLNLRGWWVIVGGESGHNARPMHPEWARSIRDQCQAAGVPFFFKQWGEWHHDPPFSPTAPKRCYMDTSGTRHEHRGSPDQFRNGHLAFDRVGKHLAGRLLDGREWSEFPVITHS